MSRRSYGSGRLYTRTAKSGTETYYGTWWNGSRRVNRKLGKKRAPNTRDGLTQRMAEAELRRQMAVDAPAASGERVDLAEVGARYRRHLEAKGRKRSTTTAVESALRVWLVPHLGDRVLDKITPEDVEDLMRAMHAAGLSAKSIRNYIGTLSSLFRFAMHQRRRWASSNPVEAVELPPVVEPTGIQFLTPDEVRSLAAAAIPGAWQLIDAALYITAAMTGLRQGELLALTWQDVDWNAEKVRVRRSYVLKEFDTPKSRRSSRAVPLAPDVAQALAVLQRESRWPEPEHLVFAEPDTGDPLRRPALMRRYRKALKGAMLEPRFRFHSLRHSFGTAMAAEGTPIRTIQEWMGHADQKTTQIYSHYSPNRHEADMVARAFARDTIPQPEPHAEPVE